MVAGGQVSLLWLEGRIGGRFGTARLSGTADDPQRFEAGDVNGLFSGVFAGGGAQLVLSPWWRIGLSFQTGVVTLPVVGHVNDEKAFSAQGGWFSGAASLGVVFDHD